MRITRCFDNFVGLFLIVPIAEHDGIAAGAKFARLAARNDAALAIDDLRQMRLNSSTVETRRSRGISVGGALKTHRARLRHPAAIVISRMFMRSTTRRITSIGPCAPALMPVRRELRVRSRESRMIEFGNEHRRHADAVHLSACMIPSVADRIEPFAGIDHGAAMVTVTEIAHHHAEAMIERHRNADAVLRVEPHGAADEIAIVEDVVMRQRDALGDSHCRW